MAGKEKEREPSRRRGECAHVLWPDAPAEVGRLSTGLPGAGHGCRGLTADEVGEDRTGPEMLLKGLVLLQLHLGASDWEQRRDTRRPAFKKILEAPQGEDQPKAVVRPGQPRACSAPLHESVPQLRALTQRLLLCDAAAEPELKRRSWRLA